MTSSIDGPGQVGGVNPIEPDSSAATATPAEISASVSAAQTLIQATYMVDGQEFSGGVVGLNSNLINTLPINVFVAAAYKAFKALEVYHGTTADPCPELSALYKSLKTCGAQDWGASPPSTTLLNSIVPYFDGSSYNLGEKIIEQDDLLSGVTIGHNKYGVFNYAGNSNPDLSAQQKANVRTFPGFPSYSPEYGMNNFMPTNTEINSQFDPLPTPPPYPPDPSTMPFDPKTGTAPYTVYASAFAYTFRTFLDPANFSAVGNGSSDYWGQSASGTYGQGIDAIKSFSRVVSNLNDCLAWYQKPSNNTPLSQGGSFLNLLINTPMGGADSQSISGYAKDVLNGTTAHPGTLNPANCSSFGLAMSWLFKPHHLNKANPNGSFDYNNETPADMIFYTICSWSNPRSDSANLPSAGSMDGIKMPDVPKIYVDSSGNQIAPSQTINWNDNGANKN
ncbi:MAG: hypothetical protein SP1CHLAM54_09950 [Chlamydiia bacterium]|nr:hypothetical protein [Chlamydiia bacterium]MCH9615901.1 hypothetical protein [Chlamydiia bacterium]MCH9628696.1 hypothetical protein [Chlamydiia bacterium]